jgi:tetratricopeptide (TPR) repeat protein
MDNRFLNNPKLKPKSLIIDLGVIFLGIFVAIGIFAVLKNVEAKRERNNLIPKAKEAVNKQEYSKAITLFKVAEKEFPGNEEVIRNLGNLYYIKGKYEDSLSYYNAIDQGKLASYEIEDVGEMYYEKKDYDKVLEKWKGKEISPENSYKLAKAYYEKDNFDEYYATLEKISSYKEPLVLLQVKDANLQNVLTNLEKAQTQNTLGIETFNLDLLKAQINDAKKQLDAGKKDYSDLIQIAAYGNLNQCKILFPKIEQLKKTLESKRISAYQVDYYKGYCLNQTLKPDEAIPLIEAAIKVDQSMVEYRESLAKSYFLKKDSKKVKEIYGDIINLQKTAIQYENLAIYLYKLEEKNEALKNYDLALSTETKNENKTKYAKAILQINLVDLKDLEICKRNELIDLLDTNTNDQNLIFGICKINNNKNLDGVNQSNNLTYSFLTAINDRNKEKLNEVLDKDVDGLLTTYYKAVGDKLIK